MKGFYFVLFLVKEFTFTFFNLKSKKDLIMKTICISKTNINFKNKPDTKDRSKIQRKSNNKAVDVTLKDLAKLLEDGYSFGHPHFPFNDSSSGYYQEENFLFAQHMFIDIDGAKSLNQVNSVQGILESIFGKVNIKIGSVSHSPKNNKFKFHLIWIFNEPVCKQVYKDFCQKILKPILNAINKKYGISDLIDIPASTSISRICDGSFNKKAQIPSSDFNNFEEIIDKLLFNCPGFLKNVLPDSIKIQKLEGQKNGTELVQNDNNEVDIGLLYHSRKAISRCVTTLYGSIPPKKLLCIYADINNTVYSCPYTFKVHNEIKISFHPVNTNHIVEKLKSENYKEDVLNEFIFGIDKGGQFSYHEAFKIANSLKLLFPEYWVQVFNYFFNENFEILKSRYVKQNELDKWNNKYLIEAKDGKKSHIQVRNVKQNTKDTKYHLSYFWQFIKNPFKETRINNKHFSMGRDRKYIQNQIEHYLLNGNNKQIINADMGSGKTTSLRNLICKNRDFRKNKIIAFSTHSLKKEFLDHPDIKHLLSNEELLIIPQLNYKDEKLKIPQHYIEKFDKYYNAKLNAFFIWNEIYNDPDIPLETKNIIDDWKAAIAQQKNHEGIIFATQAAVLNGSIDTHGRHVIFDEMPTQVESGCIHINHIKNKCRGVRAINYILDCNIIKKEKVTKFRLNEDEKRIIAESGIDCLGKLFDENIYLSKTNDYINYTQKMNHLYPESYSILTGDMFADSGLLDEDVVVHQFPKLKRDPKSKIIFIKSDQATKNKLDEEKIDHIAKTLNNPNIITFKDRNYNNSIYHGNCNGYNELQGQDLIVAGVNRKPKKYYKEISDTMEWNISGCSKRVNISWNYIENVHTYMPYLGEEIENFYMADLANGLHQAIGRARLFDNSTTVVVYGDIPPFDCDEVYESFEEYINAKKTKKEIKKPKSKQKQKQKTHSKPILKIATKEKVKSIEKTLIENDVFFTHGDYLSILSEYDTIGQLSSIKTKKEYTPYVFETKRE